MDKCKQYKVVDLYEGTQCIGYADTLDEVCGIYRNVKLMVGIKKSALIFGTKSNAGISGTKSETEEF